MQSAQERTTYLLAQADAGDPAASAQLMEVVYDELRRLAASYLRQQNSDHTLQPTALVHEAFLKLVDQTGAGGAGYRGRSHFFATAARAMRQILIDHARAKNADKRGGAWQRLTLDEGLMPSGWSTVDMVALDDALKALAELDERQARMVEMRFFGGLSVDEVAVVLGISKSTVEEDWRMARAWLSRRLSEKTRG